MFLLFLELFSGSMLVFEAAHSTSVCTCTCHVYTIGSTPKDVVFLHMTIHWAHNDGAAKHEFYRFLGFGEFWEFVTSTPYASSVIQSTRNKHDVTKQHFMAKIVIRLFIDICLTTRLQVILGDSIEPFQHFIISCGSLKSTGRFKSFHHENPVETKHRCCDQHSLENLISPIPSISGIYLPTCFKQM